MKDDEMSVAELFHSIAPMPQTEAVTLRDFFAAVSMSGMYADDWHMAQNIEKRAEDAYTMADAMLKVRQRGSKDR